MKKVLHASDLFEEKKEEKALKPIEFTHYLNGGKGWETCDNDMSLYNKIVYLGCCEKDGDMFACYNGLYILIHKGHLNDGIIE